MKKMLNTLFVTTEDTYLALDGENVTLNRQQTEIARFPLHTLESIVCFTYPGASPALMGACARRGVALSFCTPRGRFLARSTGKANGNVLLRRTQYRVADDPPQAGRMARNFLIGKLYNSRWSIERTRRDHRLRVDDQALATASEQLKMSLERIATETDTAALRGQEGAAASIYFGVFGQLILGDKQAFHFAGRNRRPPLDNVNALLSFAYMLLANDCAAALEAVGLDAAVGFLHTDRPGRNSLALDAMEELRPWVADRFVLTQINQRKLAAADFIKRENGAVELTEDARRTFLRAWQERKREQIVHPYLKEKVEWGLVPYVQALLLARCLRGDMEEYPPFLWK